jgi:hypothetical protein
MSQSTRELLERLSKLAKVAKEMAVDAVDINDDGKINWKDLTGAMGNGDFANVVEKVLGQTKRGEVLSALSVLDSKKVALRNGRSYEQMSDAELDQYEALRSTENILHATADKIEKDRHKFVAWLVDEALPVLARTLKLVMPVLA